MYENVGLFSCLSSVFFLLLLFYINTPPNVTENQFISCLLLNRKLQIHFRNNTSLNVLAFFLQQFLSQPKK